MFLKLKTVTSKDVDQCLFLAAFDIKAVVLQTFVEQLAILITHHIPAQKSCLRQQKTAHNHTFQSGKSLICRGVTYHFEILYYEKE